jgi:hypothetical protein
MRLNPACQGFSDFRFSRFLTHVVAQQAYSENHAGRMVHLQMLELMT